MSQLNERAVLMRFSAPCVGASRKDKRVTQEVKKEKGLGENAGKWIADLWPEGALQAIKAKQNEARGYHNKVTFPFGAVQDDASETEEGKDKSGPDSIAGIGILPAMLIKEYGDRMRQFQGELEKLVQDFTANPRRWIDWGIQEHNGTFNPKNYPGCTRDAAGVVQLDEEKFRAVMSRKIAIKTEPLPVPASEQFSSSITELLGVDAESVNVRVRDAGIEAQRELINRMRDPLVHMAAKCSGQLVCHCRACKGKPSKTANFKDSMIENLKEIAALVPKQNLSGDPAVDAFAKEMEALTRYTPDTLRDDKSSRTEAAAKAEELIKRLSGYKL